MDPSGSSYTSPFSQILSAGNVKAEKTHLQNAIIPIMYSVEIWLSILNKALCTEI